METGLYKIDISQFKTPYFQIEVLWNGGYSCLWAMKVAWHEYERTNHFLAEVLWLRVFVWCQQIPFPVTSYSFDGGNTYCKKRQRQSFFSFCAICTYHNILCFLYDQYLLDISSQKTFLNLGKKIKTFVRCVNLTRKGKKCWRTIATTSLDPRQNGIFRDILFILV